MKGAATNEAPETWRVECEGGNVRSVEVLRDGIMWRVAGGPVHGTPLAAVAEVAAWQRWTVVAVLAPGEATRAELAAQLAATEAEARRALDALHARCDAAEAAVAAAVEAEREACAAVCDAYADRYEGAECVDPLGADVLVANGLRSAATMARAAAKAIRARGEVR